MSFDKISLESLLGFSYSSYNSEIIPTMRVVNTTEFDNAYQYKVEIICKPTWGHTFGQMIRRIAITSIPGLKPVGFQVNDAKHIFSVVNGLKELPSDIALNLCNIVFVAKETIEKGHIYVLHFKKDEPGPVYFKDLADDTFDVINGDKILCHIDRDGYLDLKILVTEGVGFKLSTEHKIDNMSSNYLLIDTNFSFVNKCAFEVSEETSLKDKYDILTIDFDCQKPIDPEEMIQFIFDVFYEEAKDLLSDKIPEENVIDTNSEMEILSATKIELCSSLSPRTKGALLKYGIQNVKELVSKTQEQIQSIPGIGKTSVEDVLRFLKEKNLSLNTSE